MAQASNISILFLNVAGLLTTEQNTIVKDTNVTTDYNKLSLLQRTVFNKNDIIFISETKQVIDGQLPKTLDPTLITIYVNAKQDDKGAGLGLLYNPLLPTPLNLFDEFLISNVNNHVQTTYLIGRLGIFAFILQDHILVVSCLYGSSHRSSKGAAMIRLATSIVCSVTNSLKLKCRQHDNLAQIINIWGGDFNAYPIDMANYCYSGTSKPKMPKKGTLNVFSAMSELANGDGNLKYTNLHVKLEPSIIQQGYYTNITKRNGMISTKTGIDHAYVSSDHLPLVKSFSHFEVDSTISSHHALNVVLAGIWRRPQLKKSAKSMGCIPAYVFRNKSFITKLKIAVVDCVEIHKKKKKYDPALLYDHLMLELIPSMARGFHRKYIAEFIDNDRKLKCQFNALLLQGADKAQHAFHSNYLIMRENILANIRWRLKNMGHYVSDDFSSKSLAADDDDESPNLKWLKKHDAKCHDLITKVIPGVGKNQYTNITSNDKITNATYDFFKEQYSLPLLETPTLSDFLGDNDVPKSISTEDSAILDMPFLNDEILNVFQEYKIKKNTSPGKDGLPIDLFTCKDLQDILACILTDVLNSICCDKKGSQPTGLTTALIRLLLKDGKSRTDLISYRPITLMSIALRVMLRAITLRLTPFLDKAIGEFQKAYIPGRRGDHGVFLLSKIMHDAVYDVESESMILQIDFKRAFDSVKHTYVRDVLIKFGVGDKLTNLIMTIITSLNVQVIVNDQLTKLIKVDRGLPQGSSLSAILFVLCLEPLLRKGLSLGSLKGITLNGIQSREIMPVYYLAFADDLQLLLGCRSDLKSWLELLDRFSPISGLYVNMTKSALQLIGHKFWTVDHVNAGSIVPTVFATDCLKSIKLENPDTTSLNFNIAMMIKYCGVLLVIKDLLDVNKQNLMYTSWLARSDQLNSFTKYINTCPSKSFIKRARYVKSKLISKIQFLSFTSICPPAIAISIQKSINMATFGKIKCPIALNIAVMPSSLGGYGHTCISDRFAALSTTWVTQFLNCSLPVCIDLLFKDCLQAIIKNFQTAMPSLPLNMFLGLSREHLVDASLLVLPDKVTSYAIRRRTSNLFIPPFNLAMCMLKSLKLVRHWLPTDGGITIQMYKQLLFEPLMFNSMITINNQPLPQSFNALSNTLGITRVCDLLQINDVGFCFDIDAILSIDNNKQQNIEHLRLHRDFGIDGAMRLSNDLYALMPRLDIDSHSCNTAWCKLIPSTLSDFGRVKMLMEQFNFNDIDFKYDMFAKSSYPLQLSINMCTSDLSDNGTWIRACDMSTKIITHAIYFNNYNALEKSKKIRQSCHCWDKHVPLLNMDWGMNFKNLSNLNLTDDQLHFIDKVLLHNHVLSAWKNDDVMYNGDSSWVSCPRCADEQTPEHGLFTCVAVMRFWSIFTKLINLIWPTKDHVISIKSILSLGALNDYLAYGPFYGPHLKSLIATLYTFAIDAVTTVSTLPEYQHILTLDMITSYTVSIYDKFIMRFNAYLTLKITNLTRSNFDVALKPVDTLSVMRGGVSIYSEHVKTPLIKMGIHNVSKLKFLYDPFITVSLGDLVTTKLPHLIDDCLYWNHSIFQPRSSMDYVVRQKVDKPIVSPISLVKLADLFNISVHNIMRVSLFTDGSCNDNGKRTALASYSCVFPDFPDLNESLRLDLLDSQSNNRAELMAILRGLTIFVNVFKDVQEPQVPILEIYTDSLTYFKYIASSSCIVPKIKIKNFDLLQKVYGCLKCIDCAVIYHVPAHTNSTDWASFWNDKADVAAKLALKQSSTIVSW